MSQFTAPLLVTPLDDGTTWIIVTDDFAYDVGHEGSGDTVKVPQWMATDFASIPRLVRWFASAWGRHGHAAVVHDAGYYLQDRSRRAYDRIFLEAMTVSEVAAVTRRLMYIAVRCFGGLAWRANARRNRERPGWKVIDPATIGMRPNASPTEGPLQQDRASAPSVRVSSEVVRAAL